MNITFLLYHHLLISHNHMANESTNMLRKATKDNVATVVSLPLVAGGAVGGCEPGGCVAGDCVAGGCVGGSSALTRHLELESARFK